MATKKISEIAYRLKDKLFHSTKLGSLSDRLGIHTESFGKPKSLAKAAELTESPNNNIEKRPIRYVPGIIRQKAKTLEDEYPEIFELSKRCDQYDYYLYQLNEGFIVLDLGWVLTKNRHFLIESSPEPNMFNHKRIKSLLVWPKADYVDQKVVMAYNRYTINNYYHWLLEYLPRISVYIDPPNNDFSDLFSDAKIILPPSPTPWMFKSLDMLGVKEDRIIQPVGKQLRVDQLIFIPGFEQPYNVPLWAINWLRDKFSTHMITSDPKNKRIYVSRSRAIHRRVRNEKEVIDFLSNYGFVEYVLEDMSLEEQISLFSQAEIVVGPHGAGFSNLVFSTNATLIDLFEPTHVHPCFFNICYDTGQDYWYVMNEKVDRNHMLVDIDKLQRTLERAIEERGLS